MARYTAANGEIAARLERLGEAMRDCRTKDDTYLTVAADIIRKLPYDLGKEFFSNRRSLPPKEFSGLDQQTEYWVEKAITSNNLVLEWDMQRHSQAMIDGADKHRKRAGGSASLVYKNSYRHVMRSGKTLV